MASALHSFWRLSTSDDDARGGDSGGGANSDVCVGSELLVCTCVGCGVVADEGGWAGGMLALILMGVGDWLESRKRCGWRSSSKDERGERRAGGSPACAAGVVVKVAVRVGADVGGAGDLSAEHAALAPAPAAPTPAPAGSLLSRLLLHLLLSSPTLLWLSSNPNENRVAPATPELKEVSAMELEKLAAADADADADADVAGAGAGSVPEGGASSPVPRSSFAAPSSPSLSSRLLYEAESEPAAPATPSTPSARLYSATCLSRSAWWTASALHRFMSCWNVVVAGTCPAACATVP